MTWAQTNFIGVVLICGIFLAVDAPTVRAQSGIQLNPAGPFSASLEQRRAEQELRALPVKLREKRQQNFKDPKVLQQMNEDFLRLQTIRAEMAQKFGSGGLHQSSYLKQSSREIEKRASRLRSTLALSEEPEDIDIRLEPSPSIESLNDRAFQLCLEISRFTENPMFKSNGVITAKQLTEASLALDTVIALAEAVQKESSRIR